MTDYVIQKATAAKYGVVSSPENIFGCRKAILTIIKGSGQEAIYQYALSKSDKFSSITKQE